MRYLIVLFSLLISACSTFWWGVDDGYFVQLIGKHRLQFIGDTTMENALKLERVLNTAGKEVKTLYVTSGGGAVTGGMKIGELVFERNLKVVVKNLCASSCANYIATASHDTVVEKGAFLGWHGGSTQPLYSDYGSEPSLLWRFWFWLTGRDLDKETDDYIRQWHTEEVEFFNKIGVKQAITIIGMMPAYIDKRDAKLFAYNKELLPKLGANIRFQDEKPAEFLEDGFKVVQVFELSPRELDEALELHENTLRLNGWL